MVQTSHWSYHDPTPDEVEEMTQEIGTERTDPTRVRRRHRAGLGGGRTGTRDAGRQCRAVLRGDHRAVIGRTCSEFLSGRGCCPGWRITYGANGVWQMTSEGGPSSNVNSSWGSGSATWREAMHYPGGRHVGIGRRIIERFRWWDLRPIPSEPRARADRSGLFAAANKEVAIYFLPPARADR